MPTIKLSSLTVCNFRSLKVKLTSKKCLGVVLLSRLSHEFSLTVPTGLEGAIGQLSGSWARSSLHQRTINKACFGFPGNALLRKLSDVGLVEVTLATLVAIFTPSVPVLVYRVWERGKIGGILDMVHVHTTPPLGQRSS